MKRKTSETSAPPEGGTLDPSAYLTRLIEWQREQLFTGEITEKHVKPSQRIRMGQNRSRAGMMCEDSEETDENLQDLEEKMEAGMF